MFYILIVKWRLVNLSITCIKIIYVPLWTSASYSLYNFHHTFYLTWNTARILQFWILIACEELRECCCLNNSPPHDVNGLFSHLFLSNNTGIDKFFPILCENLYFSFSNLFLISVCFRIFNLNPAIPFLSLFSALYLQLFSPRIRNRVYCDISFIPFFLRLISIIFIGFNN